MYIILNYDSKLYPGNYTNGLMQICSDEAAATKAINGFLESFGTRKMMKMQAAGERTGLAMAKVSADKKLTDINPVEITWDMYINEKYPF